MPDNRATETEDKLILLSMIDGLGGCTREQLMRFALEADRMAQFRFLLALGDLLEDSLVREAETEERVMVLTPEGRETLRLFGETIRPSAAQRIRDNVPRWRTRFRDERQLPAEWQRTQDGFCVTLRALEGGEELLCISLRAETREQAQRFCARCPQEAAEIYGTLIRRLSDVKEEENR